MIVQSVVKIRFFPLSFAEVLKAGNKTIEPTFQNECQISHAGPAQEVAENPSHNLTWKILKGLGPKWRKCLRKKDHQRALVFLSFHTHSKLRERDCKKSNCRVDFSCGVCRGIKDRCLTHFREGSRISVSGSNDTHTKGYTGSYFTLFQQQDKSMQVFVGGMWIYDDGGTGQLAQTWPREPTEM